jgi:ribose 1,5-bisphosphokinase PhnN
VKIKRLLPPCRMTELLYLMHPWQCPKVMRTSYQVMAQQNNAYQIRVDIVYIITVPSVSIYADPKERKRQRARERYSQNREEINKKRREAYQQKKTIAADNSGTHTPTDVSLGNT